MEDEDYYDDDDNIAHLHVCTYYWTLYWLMAYKFMNIIFMLKCFNHPLVNENSEKDVKLTW